MCGYTREEAAPHCWASGLPPTMPPLFSNVHGNEMALGDQSSSRRLGLGILAASQSISGRRAITLYFFLRSHSYATPSWSPLCILSLLLSLPGMEASGLQWLLPGALLKVQRAAAPGAPGRCRWQSSSASNSMAVTNPVVRAECSLECWTSFRPWPTHWAGAIRGAEGGTLLLGTFTSLPRPSSVPALGPFQAWAGGVRLASLQGWVCLVYNVW